MILLMLHGRLIIFLNNYLFVDISTHHSIWSHFLMYLYLRLLILSYLDACTKTLITFNNKFFELKDAVTMGSLLVPVFVNIIMRKLKKKSIKKFIEDGTIIFYGHVVDDTLLFIKPKDVTHGHQDLISIDKNLRCTILYTLFYALLGILYPFLRSRIETEKQWLLC